MTDQLTQLRVGDESFLVSSMIERCPKLMMLRELVKNALEAAATAPSDLRLVRLSAVPVGGVPKLAIWNSGRGLDADELHRMCDIASSIRKQHRLDQNFGMGAKVASLPSNRLGLRYRSCHQGRVHEVLLGERDGVYGRLRRPGPDGGLQDVLEVTASACAEGRDPHHDWTEVVLFGNHPAQDTVRDPYASSPRMTPHWLAEELAYKFFRIPDGIQLLLDIEQEGRRVDSFGVRIPRDYSRSSMVSLPDGMRLHYVHDAADPDDPGRSHASRGALYPLHGACGLVYRDELYDVLRGEQWLHAAPVFGIPFGARGVSVFIEMPDGGIVPDGYRQFVRYAGGSQGQVFCRHFAQLVHQHRPDWLVALVEAQSPSARVSGDVYDDLDRLLRSLRVPRRARLIPAGLRAIGPASSAPAAAEAGEDPGTDGPAPRTAHGVLDQDGLPDEADGFDPEPSPELLMLRDTHEIAARGLIDRAARYYPETHQLFLNALYPAVAEMRGLLEQELAWVPDQQRVRQEALQLAEQSMAARVGRMLVFALSKQGKWPDHEVQQACSVQALSLVADDIAQSLPAARARMRAVSAAAAEASPALP